RTGRRRRLARTLARREPLVDVLCQIRRAGAAHARSLRLEALDANAHARARRRRTTRIDNDVLDVRGAVLLEDPFGAAQTDEPIYGDEVGARGACDVLAAVVAHGAFDRERAGDDLVADVLVEPEG